MFRPLGGSEIGWLLQSRFSVLICTSNRYKLLQGALEALIERTAEKPDEIVVVNGGNDDADSVVTSYVDKHPRLIDVKLIKTSNKNLATSRNTGLPHCTGDVIGMTDDDAAVFPDWVTQMKRAHREHPEAGAIGGPVIAMDRRKLASRIAEKVTFPSWSEPGYRRTLPTVNLSYKAEVIRRVGAQDEALWTSEDVDYNWRMQLLGYKVYFDPEIRVYHHHPRSLRELWRKHYSYGRGYFMLRSKWRDMYSIYPHQMATVKDWLKVGNFLLFPFYEPILVAAKMENTLDKLAVVPVELINQLVVRCGLCVEYWHSTRSHGNSITQ